MMCCYLNVHFLGQRVNVNFNLIHALTTNENLETETLQFSPYYFRASRPNRWPDLSKVIFKYSSEAFYVNIS